MTCLAKHAPLENLRSFDTSMQSLSCTDGCLAGDVLGCDTSMQSPSCADGCLAGGVYLDVFTSWCLRQSACT